MEFIQAMENLKLLSIPAPDLETGVYRKPRIYDRLGIKNLRLKTLPLWLGGNCANRI